CAFALPGGSALPAKHSGVRAHRPARRSQELLRHREGDDASVAFLVDGSDAEEEVVLREVLDAVTGDVPDLDRVRPLSLGGVPVHDLVTGEIRLRVRLPLEVRVDVERRGL